MTVPSSPPTPGQRAHEALGRCQGARRRAALKVAEGTLTPIRDGVELGDQTHARHVAAVGLMAAEAVTGWGASKPRLALLLHTLKTIEDDAVGSVGYLSRFASSLRDPLDEIGVSAETRRDVSRVAVRALAQEAPSAGIYEAPYLAFLDRLAEASGQPGLSLNMATRIGMGSCGDLNRPGWLATTGFGSVVDAEFDRDLGRVRATLDVALPAVRQAVADQGDSTAQALLERMDRYSRLPLSEEGVLWLQAATLGLLSDGYPDQPSSAVALSSAFNRHRPTSRSDRQILRSAALEEVRKAGSTETEQEWFSTRRVDSLRGQARALQYLENARWAKENAVPIYSPGFRTELGRALGAMQETEFADAGIQQFWARLIDIEQPETLEERLKIGLDIATFVRDPEMRQNLLLQVLGDVAVHWSEDRIGTAFVDELRTRVTAMPVGLERARALETGLSRLLEHKQEFESLLSIPSGEAPAIVRAGDTVVVGGIVLKVRQ